MASLTNRIYLDIPFILSQSMTIMAMPKATLLSNYWLKFFNPIREELIW